MPSQRQLVLFEKNGDDRKQAEQALRSLPYTIISAAEQEQTLALCRNQQCEVILIGLPLPEGQSLVDLLQQLRELPQPPIAVVLANPSATPEILAALRSGVLDCILKPVAQAEAELVLNRAFALAKTEKLAQIAMEERGDFYRRRLEQQEILTELVRQQNETMERALFENLRTAFVQGHGIGALGSLVSLLSGSPLTEDKQHCIVSREILDLLQKNQETINQMVQMFIELSMLSSQELMLHECSLGGLHQTIRNLVLELEPLAAIRQNKIIISELPHRHAGSVVKINQEFLIKALRELLLNALKFSPPQETITILLMNSHTCVTITVLNPTHKDSEHSYNIPEQYRRQIFTPFFRIAQTIHEQYGTLDYGLGLALVEKVVHCHRGKVRCTSLYDEKDQRELIAFEIELPV